MVNRHSPSEGAPSREGGEGRNGGPRPPGRRGGGGEGAGEDGGAADDKDDGARRGQRAEAEADGSRRCGDFGRWRQPRKTKRGRRERGGGGRLRIFCEGPKGSGGEGGRGFQGNTARGSGRRRRTERGGGKGFSRRQVRGGETLKAHPDGKRKPKAGKMEERTLGRFKYGKEKTGRGGISGPGILPIDTANFLGLNRAIRGEREGKRGKKGIRG